jgi:two-component system, NarL family, nitrate/nitrite response regulator NarL
MPNPQPIRILIADDHLIFRQGLRMLLEAEKGFTVVGQAGDGDEAVKLAGRLRPDILLLDLAMPRVPGLQALRELSDQSAPVRTILLTASVDPDQIVEALQLGARGVVLKESATEMLLKSIRSVMAGEYWVGHGSVPSLVKALTDLAAATSQKQSSRARGLTLRELQIVECIVAGLTNKDIAQKFSISEQTVKHHLSNVFDKLGVSNRLELALFAVHHHMIPDQ